MKDELRNEFLDIVTDRHPDIKKDTILSRRARE